MRIIKNLFLLLFLFACQSTAVVISSPDAPGPIALPLVTSSPADVPGPTASPRSTSTPTDTSQTSMTALPLTITVLYDNIESDPRLETAWGFAALIEHGGHLLLFDSGGNGSVLMKNISTLGIEPILIEKVILSHSHADHTGGLDALLGMELPPAVYILSSFPEDLKHSIRQAATLVEVEPGQSIVDGVLSTGKVGSSIPEQALILRTTKGMVILTGCAHPGIVRMIEQAISLTGDPVFLVMGGFHLGDASSNMIASILEDFDRMGVQKVAPSHCTGEQAIKMFQEAYGDDFIESGAGHRIVIEP